MQTLTELPKTTLYYREGSSDKVYQCNIEPSGTGFVVNFSYGRRHSILNTGTKTSHPVELEEAQRIYEKLVREKMAKGYTPGENGTPYTSPGSNKQASGLLPQLLNPIDEKLVDILLADNNWCAQEKFNGRRMLIRKQGSIITGINKKGLITCLPMPVFDAVSSFSADMVMDGESIGDNLYAFDFLELDGVDTRPWPYKKRLLFLMNLLMGVQQRSIKLADTAFTRVQKRNMLKGLREQKREGIVFKQIESPYSPGRPNSGGTQLKHKFYATCSCVVSKINSQRSVEVRLLNGEGWQIAGNVTIPANHKIPRVGQVVEVRYLYAHRQSNSLYQPVYEGLRSDVNVEECLLTQLKYKPEDEN